MATRAGGDERGTTCSPRWAGACRAAALCAGLTILAAGRARAAGPPAGLGGAAHLDASAAAYLVVRPLELADGFALLDLLGGIFPDVLRRGTEMRDGLGFYALSRAEFIDNGIDPETPFLLSLGAVEAVDWERLAAARAAAADAGKKRKPDKPLPAVFAHDRLVLRVVDAEKFDHYLAAILASHEAEVAGPVRAKGEPPLPRWHKLVKPYYDKAGLILAARLPDGGMVTVRHLGEMALVDHATPLGRPDYDQKRELPPLVERLVAPPVVALGGSLGDGARRLFTEDASVGLLVQPGPLATLMADETCRADFAIDKGTFLSELVVMARLHPFDWRLSVAWGLTPTGRQRFEGLGADDGLLDPRAAVSEGIAAAGLLVGSLETLRTAPRVGPFAAKLGRALDTIGSCGAPAALATAARFWPQLGALALDAAVPDRSSRQLLAAVRNLVAVLRDLPDDWSRWASSLVVLASLPVATGTELISMLELQSAGSPEKAQYGPRSTTMYEVSPGSGFVEAGLERLAGNFGLALRAKEASLGWYYKLKRQPARRPPQATVGYLQLNVGRLLGVASETADKGTQAALKLAGSQLGLLGGSLVLDDDLLRLDLVLQGPQ